MGWISRKLFIFGGLIMSIALHSQSCAEENVARSTEERTSRVLKIAKMGHPVLSMKAKEVANPQDPEIRNIVEDMVATVNDLGAYAGLAAPQVHIPLRIVLFAVPSENGDEIPLTVMINPVWEPISDEKEEDWEGCFSLPDLMGKVSRYKKIRYQYQTLDGESVSCDAEGFHARVVQHECDHLDGKFYIEHVKDFSDFGYCDEMRRYRKKS
jgi:peptide deformylase